MYRSLHLNRLLLFPEVPKSECIDKQQYKSKISIFMQMWEPSCSMRTGCSRTVGVRGWHTKVIANRLQAWVKCMHKVSSREAFRATTCNAGEGNSTKVEKVQATWAQLWVPTFTALRHLLLQLTYLLTYSLKQSPSWEANRFSTSQEIPRTLRNPKVHYRLYKCPLHVPILSQLDSFHLRLGLPSCLFSSGFPSKPSSPHTLYMPRPSNSPRFYHPNNIEQGVQIIKLLIM